MTILLREIDEYTTGPQKDNDSIDRMVEGEHSEGNVNADSLKGSTTTPLIVDLYPFDHRPRREGVQTNFRRLSEHYTDCPNLFGNRKERVLTSFQLSESEHHIDTLLTAANLGDSSLLLSLLDPRDLQTMHEYFNLSAEEVKTFYLQLPDLLGWKPTAPPKINKGKGKASYSGPPKRTSQLGAEAPKAKQKRTLNTSAPAEVRDILKGPATKDRLLLPAVKVVDKFPVPNVFNAQIEATFDLPPHFFVIFQALYKSFFHKD
ncbi:hypothetical protein L484_014872 [Morus notabilis]|uniref:Uncharacterized protein n=1 Tax=Morus notabilis TaxID=981085 RepID=W9SA39_9ROSA|nr:hypothetical protein L484_014872 [Morus notabilis]